MKNQTFGLTIATLRKEKGLTQLELAKLMGVTDKAVSKWERDLSYPDINSLPKLAEIFNLSLDELMQIKSKTEQDSNSQIKKIINLILKTMPLAMGVSVTVLSILKEIDIYSGMTLLGIGLTSMAIYLFQEQQ